MPTFKSYVSDPGYYINARPSDVGNITYQIDSEAAKFILTLGYENEDELPWGLVKPLRVAGLVYTNSQGVTEDDEGIPGLDPSKLPSLSKNDREELLEYLDGRGDIDNDVLEGLRSQIVDDKDDAEILAEAIEKRVDESVDVEISRSKGSNGNYGSTTISIEIEPGFKSPSDTRVISHHLGAFSSPGVDEWEVTHNFGEGWQGAAQATEAKILIMNALAEVSDQFSFDFHPYNEDGTML